MCSCMERKRFSWDVSSRQSKAGKKLTPRQRLRQLEPSLFLRGQTTSLVASETEKELVREVRGGMLKNIVQSQNKREQDIKMKRSE